MATRILYFGEEKKEKKHPILSVWYAPLEKVPGLDFCRNFFTRPFILREVYKIQHNLFFQMCRGPVKYMGLLPSWGQNVVDY